MTVSAGNKAFTAYFGIAIHGRWIPAIPAGMTGRGVQCVFVYKDERGNDKTKSKIMIWKNSQQLSLALETTFSQIWANRMRDLPVVNAALSVQAVGFTRFGEEWLGIVITPWFMNLMLLPGSNSAWREHPPGTKIEKHFPYGVFEFTLGSEPQLGIYALCSLFSPMFQFENQAAAHAAAKAALQGLLTEVAPRDISRRDLLRGSLGNGKR